MAQPKEWVKSDQRWQIESDEMKSLPISNAQLKKHDL